MKKLCILAVVLASPASAMSYITPTNVATACVIAQAVEGAVLADEALANQVAGKTIVRTGATATIQNVTPALCAQIQAAAAAVTALKPAAAPAK